MILYFLLYICNDNNIPPMINFNAVVTFRLELRFDLDWNRHCFLFHFTSFQVFCVATYRNLGVCHAPLPLRSAYGQTTLKTWVALLDIRPSLKCLGISVLVITSRRKQPHGHGSWQPRSMEISFILHGA